MRLIVEHIRPEHEVEIEVREMKKVDWPHEIMSAALMLLVIVLAARWTAHEVLHELLKQFGGCK